MARKLQIKLGRKANMPALAEGELGFATDEKKVYIGTGSENVPVSATTKADVGLGNVDNTSDANKPVSTAMQTALNGKANKLTYVKATLTAANWNKTTKTYSFESTYPHAQYDIEVAYAKTCTTEQLDAWNGAMLAGDIESNVVTALGDVPTADIPIIVEVVRK